MKLTTLCLKILALFLIFSLFKIIPAHKINIKPRPVLVNNPLDEVVYGSQINKRKDVYVSSEISFTVPKEYIHFYRLKKFDQQCHSPEIQKSVTYASLLPPEYLFGIISLTNSHFLNKKNVWFNIFVKQPFQATLWFLALVILFLATLLYLLYRVHLHFIKARTEELEKINQKLKQEINEREAVQRALNESERKLTMLIKNLPGIAYRSMNDSKRTMTFISEGAIQLTGYRPEVFVQKPVLSFTELIHPDDREGVLQEIQEKIFKKAAFQLIYRLITSIRQVRWVWEQGRGIYNEQGDCIAIEGFIIDISERKQLEEQLVQAQKMEAVGQLAGGIAHDFNNLLTVIRGYSELSLALLDKGTPVFEKVEQIDRAVDRAEALTRQLLAFSRKQVLKSVVLSLNKQIGEIEKMLRRLIGEHIQLETYLDAKSDRIKADPGKIEQIILNLAINARDAMPQGGTLTISTSNVIMDDDFSGFYPELKAGKYVMLTISDTGTGMDEETKNHIFVPFFTTKKSGKGTGLGLAMVYGIVNQSNGHITVTSQQGAGTTFMIYFPKVKDEIISSIGVGKTAENIKGQETILVVEDKKEVRQVIAESLGLLGYTIIQAEHGKQALKIFNDNKDQIALLLTDIIMPEMNGKDLALKLKRQKETLKVIFMSGYTDNTLGDENNLSPGTHFIQKPFTTFSLARQIREALD